MRNILIGQIIGIVRACNNNPKKDSTDGFIIECIDALRGDDCRKIGELSARAAEEKRLIAPDCATCSVRCGGTDDYDMSVLGNSTENVRKMKLEILDEIYKVENFTPDAIECIYDGFFAVGESWGIDYLTRVRDSIKNIREF